MAGRTHLGKVETRGGAGIAHQLALGRGKGRELAAGPRRHATLPLGGIEIKQFRFDGLIDPAAGLAAAFQALAGIVEIQNGLDPCLAGFAGLMVQGDARFRQVVEERRQTLVIEWQPVLHAGMGARGAYRLVKRVVAHRAE